LTQQVGGVIGMTSNALTEFMIITFQKAMEKAERLGDKETQNKMQQQIAWLQQQQFNKYRN
tara:strand:- start:517 stop:699 length:183 start_codon:yes stop_codon:yes gene_type:complete